MYRYKPHRSIAATLPHALPDAATISAGSARARRRRRLLPIGLAAAALVTAAFLAAGAVPLPWRATTPPPRAAPLDRAVVRSVAVGARPVAMVTDARAGRVVVAAGDNGSGGRLSILDATTGALLKTVGLGANPSAVALDTRRGRAVVVTDGSFGVRARTGVLAGAAISIVDERSGRIVRAIRRGALAVAADEGTGHIFATSPGSFMRSHGRLAAGQIAMFDQNGRLLRAYVLGPYPAALAVDRPAGHVLVTTAGAFPNSPGAVSVLDARSGRVVRTIPAGPSPSALVVDEARGWAFVLNNAYGSAAYLSVLDTRAGRLVRTVPLAGAGALILDAHVGRVFVRTAFNTVAVLDAGRGRIVKIVPVEGYTRYALNPGDALAVDETRGRVFVPGDRHTIVLDAATGRVLRALSVPAELIAVNGGNGRAFAAHQDQSISSTGGLFSQPSTPIPARVSTLDLAR